MLLLILYLLLAVVVSFSCSIMESVLLTTPPSFVWVQADKGKAWALHLQKFKENIDRPLSAILSLNTVAHTIGAAGVGAQAVKVFGQESFGIVSALLTLIILVVTEIIPKTLGAMYWRGLAPFCSRLIRLVIWITYPLVLVSSVITRLLSGGHKHKTTSREELVALTEIAKQEGVVSDNEHVMLLNIMRLQQRPVTEIMTPRTVVQSVAGDTTVKAFCENKENYSFSRIPVYTEHKETIAGYLFRLDVYEQALAGNTEKPVKECLREILTIPNKASAYHVWQKLLERKEHMAVIVDEYGGMDGLVTLEDILESVVGREIVDERDVITSMRDYAKELWQKRQQASR